MKNETHEDVCMVARCLLKLVWLGKALFIYAALLDSRSTS